MPEPVIVPHENLGVAMAHGYTMITGRPQAMMVHVGMGTANAINGLINAARMNIPMLFTAGRTPLTESGAVHGARNNYIHWAQEHFDQGAMLREFVKWDYELRHPEQIEPALDRALAIAMSAPQGPVYMTLPREILAAPLAATVSSERPLLVSATPPAPDSDTLEEVAKLLAKADRPLLITANAGRTVEATSAVTSLAEHFAIPVVHYRPRYLALSTEHPMHAGWEPHALLGEADLVLVVDCDVPWIPAQGGPKADATVVHIGPDPLFDRYPMRSFRTDVALTGLVAPTLSQLLERALRHAPARLKLDARREEVGTRNGAARQRARAGVASVPSTANAKYASACLNSPAKTVVCAVGDGAYMFGNPTPAHFVSEAMQLPVLFVVFNNARWAAVHRSTLAMYPKGAAAQAQEPPFAVLEPSPRFEKVVEASGGYGERVAEPKGLIPALQRALRVVKEEKRQALVNVCLEASYVKTS
jgi:acetolactate synthase-1/2/3 large subunit